MKKITLLFFLVQTVISCAQIYPLNSPDAPSGSYIKDINHELDPFVGTWEATWNNKKITLYLIKMDHTYTKRFKGGNLYEDIVIGKYKVVDLSTGATLEDTTNITNIEDMPIESTVLIKNKNLLWFLYSKGASTSADCDILSNVLLYRDINNPNILTYKYFIDSYEDRGCPYTNVDDIPVNIPKQEVILHKL